MGWMIVIAAKPLLEHLPIGGLYWLLAGGAAYSLGTVFYLWEKLPFHHAVWHLFVLAGSICHFFAVLLYLLPT
jgi:hemolysin III